MADPPGDPPDSQRNGPGGGMFGNRSRHEGFSVLRAPVRRPPVVREPSHSGTLQPRPPQSSPAGHGGPNVQANGEFVSVRKEAIAGLIPLAGEFAASYLGRPAMPQPSGDPNIDFANAALHRDALALHGQNRDRIRVLSNLAERAVKLMMS